MAGDHRVDVSPVASLQQGVLPPWIVARAPCFLDLIDQVRKLASFDVTVLVEGETGVGKELVVRLLHYLGSRTGQPFVPVNAGAIPEALFEDELFGHAAGAYTGARGASEGLIALADGGTLFLDEIDALSPHGQAALLRFLQDRSYRPVGARTLKHANVRVVTATNADPRRLMDQGMLRQDLYFRLAGLSLKVPPLRERTEDILPLSEHFLSDLNAGHPSGGKRQMGASMKHWLLVQAWPGNVRELRSAIERSFILAEGNELLPPSAAIEHMASLRESSFRTAKAMAVEGFERSFLDRLLIESHGNVSQAARNAGKERKSFDRLLRKHGIDCAQYRDLRA